MYEWTRFDTVFEKASKWTYEQTVVHTISRNRQNMEGVLFFDRICGSVGLNQATKLYPPKTNQDLHKLFDTVVKATAPDLQKHVLIYYILKDCKSISDHGDTFARKVYLPRKYRVLVSGLHNLDHGHTRQALESLTDPSLTPTFSDQILYTLLQSARVDNSLAMAYYVTVSPPLQDQKTLDAYFSFLCDTHILHAYHCCQTRVDSQRKALFEQLILAALSPRGDQTASRAETLVALPFTDDEVRWFEDFLLHGKGSSCHGAKDSVAMRRIATSCDYMELHALRRFRGQKVEGMNWGDVRNKLHPNDIV